MTNGLVAVARRRLTDASDAWLDAQGKGLLTQEIVDEYYAAHTALVDLNDALLFNALDRTSRYGVAMRQFECHDEAGA